METPFSELRQKVQAELNNYKTPEPHPETVGLPLPPSWFSGRLAEMRAALVMPHASKIRDCVEGTGELVIVDVAIVADDGQGTIVAYDPAADTYVLATNYPDPDTTRDVNIVACGIRGTAVDCFLSA